MGYPITQARASSIFENYAEIEDLYDSESLQSLTTARIRSFLRAYYLTWGIQFVLLVGDYETLPMPIAYPDPQNHVYDPSDPGLVAPGTPTNCYYADLSYPDSLSWDLDGDGYIDEYCEDGPDFLAEVAVGRIPVSDTPRIRYRLDKIADPEEASGPWKRSALQAAAILFFKHQNCSEYQFKDGAACFDSIEKGIAEEKT